jgi:endonuclease-3
MKKATKRRSNGAAKGRTSKRSPERKRRANQSPERKRRAGAPRAAETDSARRARAARILASLRVAYPGATCALRHGSALQLLVATILSAQCTDERVNRVTPDLFRRYPDAAALAAAEPADLEAAIRSTGFFRNKAKSLLGMARLLCAEFGGQVPETMEGLLRLPGVARKTANCVLGTWHGKNVGIVVDTHVGRLAVRLGLTTSARDSKDAEKIERDLMELFPQEWWTYLAHALIWHGREVCTARKPQCERCPLSLDCPSAGKCG